MGFLLNPPALAAVTYRLIALTYPQAQAHAQAIDSAILERLQTIELAVLTVGCIIFAGMNLNLLRTLVRDGQFMTLWNDAIAELERVNRIEGDLQVFSSPRYLYLRNARDRLQTRLIFAAGCAMVAWLAISVIPFTMIFGDAIKGVMTWMIGWCTFL